MTMLREEVLGLITKDDDRVGRLDGVPRTSRRKSSARGDDRWRKWRREDDHHRQAGTVQVEGMSVMLGAADTFVRRRSIN